MSLKTKISFFRRFDVRLTFLYTIIFFLLGMVLSSFLYYRLDHNLIKQVSILLADEVHEFKTEINEEILTDHSIKEGCELFADAVSKRKYFPIYFRLFTSSGKKVFQSDNELILSFPQIEDKIDPGKYKIKKHGNLLVIEEYFYISSLKETFIVQIGTSLKRIAKIKSNFFENIIIAIPVMLLCCISAGMFASRKVRSIFKNITTMTRKITSQNLKERLNVPPEKGEIQDLILTINSMMDRLEKSFDQTKQFTSDVSHELRNPLFALKGELEVTLSQTRNADEYSDSMTLCLDRINVLIKMVNDLFLISRFDAGKVIIDFEEINFFELLRDLYDFFLPMAQEKNIKFTIEHCDEIIFRGDKIKMSQLLNNLLDNAVKFTPENGSIKILLCKTDDGQMELTVRNTGSVLSEEQLEKVFNRFYQADPSRNGIKNGTGLGLHICKRIVDAHKGSIKALQDEDQGVSFVVLLPI